MKLGANSMNIANSQIFPIIGEEIKLPFYVVGIGGHKNQPPVTRVDGYPNYQIIYCTRGSGVLFIGGNKYKFPQNTGFVLYPHIPHEYYSIDDPWETHWVTFDGIGVMDLFNTLGFHKSEFFYVSNVKILDILLEEILTVSKSDSIDKGYRNSSLLYNFILSAKDYFSKELSDVKSANIKRLKPVFSFIDTNFNEQLSIETLANFIDVSPQYLCRLFMNVLYMRPFVYITKRRIQEAKHLLLKSEMDVKDISNAVGYTDISYFCATFKKQEHISPLEFRRLHKNKGQGD